MNMKQKITKIKIKNPTKFIYNRLINTIIVKRKRTNLLS